MVTFYGDPLIAVDHVYDYRNKYDNFTLLASNKPIKQINFDSSGTLVSETAMTPSGTQEHQQVLQAVDNRLRQVLDGIPDRGEQGAKLLRDCPYTVHDILQALCKT